MPEQRPLADEISELARQSLATPAISKPPNGKQANGNGRSSESARRSSIDRLGTDSRRARRLGQRPRAIAAWITILICLVVAVPAMLINLHTPDIIDATEAQAVAKSIETWTRLNTPEAKGENWIESLVPHANGKQVWLDPPGVTWMQLIFFEAATTTYSSERVGRLTVNAEGLLHVGPMLDLPGLPTTKVTELTLAEMSAAVQQQVERASEFVDVRVSSAWSTSEKSANGESKEINSPAAAKKSDANRRVKVGDGLTMTIQFVEPVWRNHVELSSMIEWARHGSLIMALITIAAVFWAGYSIGGLRTGTFSALVCAANPVFIWHARMASMPIHQTMWAMLSIAAAIWAIRPLRPSASIERQFTGWLICGLMFGAAGMATGPLVVVSVALPILLILLLCPNRIGHLIGLVAALLIGVLMVLPWTALLHNHDPDVAIKWLAEHQPFGQETVTRFLDDAGQRTLLVLASMLPWTLWLIAAALQPFSTSSTGSRTRLFIGWTWFVMTILIAVTMPNAEGLGVLLPLVPAGSLVVGQLFRQYADMADEGRFARLWRWVRWPHLLLLVGASVIVPAMVTWPEPFIEQGWIDKPIFAQNGWPFAIGLMTVLLAIIVLSLRFVLTHYPGRALMCWAVWGFTLASVMAFPATRSKTAKSVIRPEAERVREHVGDRPLYAVADATGATSEVAPAFSLYLHKRAKPATTEQIKQIMLDEKDAVFILTGAKQRQPFDEATLILHLPVVEMNLWRAKAKEKEPDDANPANGKAGKSGKQASR